MEFVFPRLNTILDLNFRHTCVMAKGEKGAMLLCGDKVIDAVNISLLVD
jgi:hypothetical protein